MSAGRKPPADRRARGAKASSPPPPGVRERIVEAAYELLSTHGVASTGTSAIIERANVARMSLYHHFHSKDDLVTEFLDVREQRWTVQWLQNEVKQRTISPRHRLLVIFEVFDEWFQKSNFEGCSFINVLLESHADSIVRQAAARHLFNIRQFIKELAEEAKMPDAASFAHVWHMLMKGSIVAAQEGNRDAARLAKIAGEILIKNWQGQPE